jgi:hypothetical protein
MVAESCLVGRSAFDDGLCCPHVLDVEEKQKKSKEV